MKKFAGWLLPAVIALGLSIPGVATADVNDFTVTQFTADYYLTKDDPQGQMHVVEKIFVHFTDQNHGLLRALPTSYKYHRLNLHINSIGSDSDAPSHYTTYGQNGNLVLKIGDPDRTVTGNQEYTIDYTEQNVISFYSDHDELYWNINGDQWNQPFTAVHAVVHLPAGAAIGDQQPRCYAGAYGSTAQDCRITSGQDGVIAADGANLNPGDTLTVVVGFQKGFFRPFTWWDTASEYIGSAVAFLIPFLLLSSAAGIWWFKRGRDAKGSGVIIPQYGAPDDLRPLECGVVLNFKAGGRDFTATLIDLAVRGYIKIIEKDSKNLFGKNKKFAVQVVQQDWHALTPWEGQLLGGLSNEAFATGEADLSKPMRSLQTVVTAIKKAVDKSLMYRGYFRSNPYTYTAIPVISIIVVLWFFGPMFGSLFDSTAGSFVKVGLAAGIVVAAIFYHFMPARTAQGVTAKEHIQGLKMYLEVAEKDRIAMLQSPDAPYAEKSAAPVRTVELFEKLLPYAIALKVENEWAKKFENVYASPPDWYVGNYAAFNAGYLAGSLGGSFGSAVGSSFAAPRSSGGSGFGGGAGGGGGGGGGGGW